jgi:hypothetical protein
MKKKLKLNELNIQSFTTTVTPENLQTLRGGQNYVEEILARATGALCSEGDECGKTIMPSKCPIDVTKTLIGTGFGMCLCNATNNCTGAAGC